MKKCIFVYKDRVTKAFTNPIIDERAKENYVETMKRAFIVEPERSHVRNKDCSLYFLGYYDDINCKFELLGEPEFIFNVDDLEWKGENRDIQSCATTENA